MIFRKDPEKIAVDLIYALFKNNLNKVSFTSGYSTNELKFGSVSVTIYYRHRDKDFGPDYIYILDTKTNTTIKSSYYVKKFNKLYNAREKSFALKAAYLDLAALVQTVQGVLDN